MPRALALVLPLTLACYASHGLSGEAVDAGTDAAPSDALRFDAPARDAARSDVGVPACPGGLVLLDQRVVDWDPVDCGAATHPRALAVEGAHGPFQLVITEERFCDDRPGAVWARPVSIEDGRLRLGPSEGMGYAQGPAHLASNGDEFAACSSAALYVRTAEGVTLSEMLREPPVSVPGCPQGLNCLGLAHDGAGWGAIWDRFECDVSLPEISRSGPRGGLREEPFAPAGRMSAIASAPDGFASLARRSDITTLYTWSRDSDAPTALELDPIRASPFRTPWPLALSAWPFASGAWAVLFTDEDSIGLRVVDEAGRVLLERVHPAALVSYAPESLSAASGSFGVVVGVGYGWTGGRVDTATRIMAFDENGDVFVDEAVVDLGVAVEAPIHVAVKDSYVLVHRTRATPDPSSAGTEVLLFACE